MIRDEAQLELVRRQLGNLEAALHDLEADVRPKSEKWFALMCEAYVNEIEKLKSELDEYHVAHGLQTSGRLGQGTGSK